MRIKIKQEELGNLSKRGIYRIYLVESGKSYVGSTWKTFKTRWKQHLRLLNNNKHHSNELQQDYIKYGTDAFCVEILEVVDSEVILLEREAFFIDKYDAINKGYNENPDPSRSPMLNKSSCVKSSITHKKQWENLKNSMSEEEFELYKEEYAKKRGFVKGQIAWNKGKKMTEEQTLNMKKPKVHGVSKAMKSVHLKNKQDMKDKAPYIIVYDLNKKWINTFWSTSDLVEYSETEFNTLPLVLRKNGKRTLNNSKICQHATDGTPYKGLYLKRAPKSMKISYANAANSWKALSEPIMSQTEGTPSGGAETSGEVKSS